LKARPSADSPAAIGSSSSLSHGNRRVAAPRGRRKSPKAHRPGYPAFVLGSSAVTKTLVEIAALEPVAVNDIPERERVTDANLGHTVRRLTALGIVRRYHDPLHAGHYLLTLNPDNPLIEQLRAVLRGLARKNRLRWAPSAPTNEFVAVDEGPNVTNLRIFGRGGGDVECLFGHPNRTIAIILVGALGRVDPSTIARVAGVPTDGDMLRLIDPIEADGLVVSEMVGSIRLYQFPKTGWTPTLTALIKTILDQHPLIASRVAAAKVLMLSGGFSNRVHLRRKLGFE